MYAEFLIAEPTSLIKSLHKRLRFPLKIYPVNVTKFTIFIGFGHIYRRNP